MQEKKIILVFKYERIWCLHPAYRFVDTEMSNRCRRIVLQKIDKHVKKDVRLLKREKCEYVALYATYAASVAPRCPILASLFNPGRYFIDNRRFVGCAGHISFVLTSNHLHYRQLYFATVQINFTDIFFIFFFHVNAWCLFCRCIYSHCESILYTLSGVFQ